MRVWRERDSTGRRACVAHPLGQWGVPGRSEKSTVQSVPWWELPLGSDLVGPGITTPGDLTANREVGLLVTQPNKFVVCIENWLVPQVL